jgi:uncharacterized protein YodC (DUF2158 family)
MMGVHVRPSIDANGRPVCETCNEPVDPNANGVFSLVVGWVQKREGGGAHGISGPEYLGRYRCRRCHKFGNQESMFG